MCAAFLQGDQGYQNGVLLYMRSFNAVGRRLGHLIAVPPLHHMVDGPACGYRRTTSQLWNDIGARR